MKLSNISVQAWKEAAYWLTMAAIVMNACLLPINIAQGKTFVVVWEIVVIVGMPIVLRWMFSQEKKTDLILERLEGYRKGHSDASNHALELLKDIIKQTNEEQK